MDTFASSWEKALARAAPIPELAPVTMTTLFFKSMVEPVQYIEI
jgi:hypothetical protein